MDDDGNKIANPEFGRVTETMIEEMEQGDTRSAFLRENKPHLLYLWHLADTMDILSNVLNVLSKDVQVDCENIRTDLATRKKKRSSGGSSTAKKRKKTRTDNEEPPAPTVAAVSMGNSLASMAIDSKEGNMRQTLVTADGYMLRALEAEDNTALKSKLEELSEKYYDIAAGIQSEINALKGSLTQKSTRNLVASFDSAATDPTVASTNPTTADSPTVASTSNPTP